MGWLRTARVTMRMMRLWLDLLFFSPLLGVFMCLPSLPYSLISLRVFFLVDTPTRFEPHALRFTSPHTYISISLHPRICPLPSPLRYDLLTLPILSNFRSFCDILLCSHSGF